MEIKNTNTHTNNRISMLVYGPSGIGKTTLAKTLEGKTLIISAESGLLSLAGSNIDYVEISGKNASEKIASLRTVLTFLQKMNDYNNVFIDSLTEIGQIMVEYQFDMVANDRSKSLVAWGEYAKQIRMFVKLIRDFAPYNVIVTALDKADKDEFSRRFILPEMQGSISTQVAQYFDEVLYYNYVSTDKEPKRVLFTDSVNGCVCKDRSGKLSRTEEPNLKDIFEKIRR